MQHAERRQDLVGDVLRVAPAGDGGDERLEQREAVVAVDVHVAGRGLDALDGDRVEGVLHVARPVRRGEEVRVVRPGQAGRVVHEHAHGDLPPRGGEGGERRDVARERGVEVDEPLVGELHDGHCGEHLADRADAVHGVRAGRGLCGLVGVAEALAPDDLVAAHEGHGDGRRARLLQESVRGGARVLDGPGVAGGGLRGLGPREGRAGTEREQQDQQHPHRRHAHPSSRLVVAHLRSLPARRCRRAGARPRPITWRPGTHCLKLRQDAGESEPAGPCGRRSAAADGGGGDAAEHSGSGDAPQTFPDGSHGRPGESQCLACFGLGGGSSGPG